MRKIEAVLNRIMVESGISAVSDIENTYAQKFLITSDIDAKNCHQIKNRIFPGNADFPNSVYSGDFVVRIMLGGFLLTEEDYSLLQELAKKTNQPDFFVLEDQERDDAFCLKYACGCSHEEITSFGGEVSFELFERPIRNYYVFDGSGKWGMFFANDAEHPIVLVGVHPDLVDENINRYFRLGEDTKNELSEIYPNIALG